MPKSNLHEFVSVLQQLSAAGILVNYDDKWKHHPHFDYQTKGLPAATSVGQLIEQKRGITFLAAVAVCEGFVRDGGWAHNGPTGFDVGCPCIHSDRCLGAVSMWLGLDSDIIYNLDVNRYEIDPVQVFGAMLEYT